MNQPKKRAFLSVSNTRGLTALARDLNAAGWELAASRGTGRHLRNAGFEVIDAEKLTGYPPILEHRVVTMHPAVHGGILAKRGDPVHEGDLREHEIDFIDLVVVNFYDFDASPNVENIDIGGPALARAAAKNHEFVGVVVDPGDYDLVAEQITRDGKLSDELREKLARKAFAHTAAYEVSIANWMNQSSSGSLPLSMHLSYWGSGLPLRYGENPHQRAGLYAAAGQSPWWLDVRQYGAFAMSYLNYYDADTAWQMVNDLAKFFGMAAVVIVKHANPCGVAIADTLAEAYQKAYDCDPRSAFGGVVALSQPVDEATAELMVAAAQADVIIAPGYADGVSDKLLGRRKNTRVLEAPAPERERWHLRPITGGLLVQEPYRFEAGFSDWNQVAGRKLTDDEIRDAHLAWRVCGWTKSNAIVIAKNGAAWGIGAGQQNRVESAKLAIDKAGGNAQGGVLASDAFIPFADTVEVAAAAGVTVIIQTGGSLRDDEVTARAQELGLSMMHTGERQFRH